MDVVSQLDSPSGSHCDDRGLEKPTGYLLTDFCTGAMIPQSLFQDCFRQAS